MIQIRCGVFETNSSSVHSLCMCSEDAYSKWANDLQSVKKDSYLYDSYNDELVSIDDVLSAVPSTFESAEEIWFTCINTNRYKTVDSYNHMCNNNWYEQYEHSYTTKSGDNVVAFGYFGHD